MNDRPIVVFHDDHEECERRITAAENRAGELAADLIEARRERDEARDEVVRLGRSLEQSLELVAALRAASDRDAAELARLRTIIVELGAGEAAEPEPIDITPLLLKHPPGPVTLASLIAQPEEQIEALRPEESP